MSAGLRRFTAGVLCAAIGLAWAARALADVALGGFIPLVGIGLTNQFQTFDQDTTFFIADPSFSWGGTPLGPGSPGGPAYFDLALLDTGAATHILTQAAASASGFNIQGRGFRGNNFQTIFGASGSVDLRINNPLGVYATGLSQRTASGTSLTMNTAPMRGQTSFALLEAPSEWKLPNILGLPIAAHHAISIRNDQPQIFEHQGRTVRSPNVEFVNLGSGADQGILRRTDLRIRPSSGFLQGPFYMQSTEMGPNFEFNFHKNPLSPSVIENGAMFVEIDLRNGARSLEDKEFLFDTGADLSVVSQLTAARLGFDVLLDTPEFVLEVEGAGGVTGGIPGFYIDELNIDTMGGSFTLQRVPVAVLDLPNPNDPANVLDGILGMHVFNGRNLVIDANPAASPTRTPPRLYISDPVTQTHTWATSAASANWATAANWSAAGTPGTLWIARAANVSGSHQTASVTANSQVYELHVSGAANASMTVRIEENAKLTTFGQTLIQSGGRVELVGGTLDTQFVNIEGGTLAGSGVIFAGTGPVHSPVRNMGGRIEPGAPIGLLTIDGDLSQLASGTIAIDLGGITAVTQHDQLAVGRNAFLGGTLEVNLSDFTPSVGNAFTILTAGHVVGQFHHLLLPAGFVWDVVYGANAVTLTVTAAGLSGDFNGDGRVDAADYVVWRKDGGSNEEYLAWRSNLGAQSGQSASADGTSSLPAVPEPASVLHLAFAACIYALRARRLSCGGAQL